MTYRIKMNQLHRRYVKLRIASTLIGLAGFAGFVLTIGIVGAVETDSMTLAASLKPTLFGIGLTCGSAGICNRLEIAYRRTWKRMRKLTLAHDAAMVAHGAANAGRYA